VVTQGGQGRRMAALRVQSRNRHHVCSADNARSVFFVLQLTLGCTIGYLENMVDGSIKLVILCNASSRWPLGYVIHAEDSFEQAAEFRDFIDQTIDNCMQEPPR